MHQQSVDLNSYATDAELGYLPLDVVAPMRYFIRITPRLPENRISGNVKIFLDIKKQNVFRLILNARLISIKEVYFRSNDSDAVLKNPFVNIEDEIVTIDFSPRVLKVCPYT